MSKARLDASFALIGLLGACVCLLGALKNSHDLALLWAFSAMGMSYLALALILGFRSALYSAVDYAKRQRL